MNWKKYISVIPILILLLVCVSTCQAGNPPQTAGQEPAAEQTESAPEGETMTRAHIGEFDFENHAVLLNSGYTMPVMGLGTYALDHNTCVNSVKALLENGGRLIDTAAISALDRGEKHDWY